MLILMDQDRAKVLCEAGTVLQLVNKSSFSSLQRWILKTIFNYLIKIVRSMRTIADVDSLYYQYNDKLQLPNDLLHQLQKIAHCRQV